MNEEDTVYHIGSIPLNKFFKKTSFSTSPEETA